MTDSVGVKEGTDKQVATNRIGGLDYQLFISAESDASPTGLAAKLGATNESAPASDTAAAGLNGRLQRIAQRITSLIALIPTSLGQKAKSASLAVTLASDEDTLTLVGAVNESAPASDTASSGLNGRLQRIAQRLTSLIAVFTLGSGAGSAGVRVVGATDDAIQGATNETAPASDTAASGHNGRLQRIAQRITSLIALLPSAIGRTTSSGSLSTVVASDDAMIGIVTETAPASDTASSGLNGRLQRIAQRITSLIALVPTSLGGKTAANSFAVTIASDDPSRPRYIFAVGSTLTRPANTTAYSINDSVSNNGTAGSVTALTVTAADVNDAPVAIERLTIDTTDTGVQGKTFRAYLYRSDPTASSGVGGGDNAAFSNKKTGFIGCMSGTFRTFSDGAKATLVPDEGSEIITTPGSGAMTVWWQLQTLDAFTPSANSTTFVATLEGYQGRA